MDRRLTSSRIRRDTGFHSTVLSQRSRRWAAFLFIVLVLVATPWVQVQARAPQPETLAGEFVGVGTVDAMGAFNYAVPIGASNTSAGRSPAISLTYSNHAGNGFLGWGWSLSGLSMIDRCAPRKGEIINNSDPMAHRAYCLDGERLKLLAPSATQIEYGADGTQYGVEKNNGIRVTARGDCNGVPCGFEVAAGDGSVRYYGTDGAGTESGLLYGHADSGMAKRVDPTHGGQTVILTDLPVAWALVKEVDANGNSLKVEYRERRGVLYPEVIYYGGHELPDRPHTHALSFSYNYDFDTDVFERTYHHFDRSYQNGGLVDASGILLEDVHAFAGISEGALQGAAPVATYSLYYDQFDPADAVDGRGHARHLQHIQLCVFAAAGNFTAESPGNGCLAPLDLIWRFESPGWDTLDRHVKLYRLASDESMEDWNAFVNYLTFASLALIPLEFTPLAPLVEIVDLVFLIVSLFDFNSEPGVKGAIEIGELADLTGDGLPDYVAECQAGTAGCGATLHRGDGAMEFESASTAEIPRLYGVIDVDYTYETGFRNADPFSRPRDRILADIDGDGFDDIVFREGQWTDESYQQFESDSSEDEHRTYLMRTYHGDWRIKRNNGDGTFTELSAPLPGPLDAYDLGSFGKEADDETLLRVINQPLGKLLDLNGDKRLDYVLGYCDPLRDSENNVLIGHRLSCEIHLQTTDGDWVKVDETLPTPLWGRNRYLSFYTSSSEAGPVNGLEMEEQFAYEQHTGQFDGDEQYGRIDTYAFYGYTLPLWNWVHTNIRSVKPENLARLADLNGDGFPDLVRNDCAIGQETCVWFGTGGAGGSDLFVEAPSFDLALSPQVNGKLNALFMDFNGDGILDQLAVGDACDNDRCDIYHGTGLGFAYAGKGSYDLFNGDGEPITYVDINKDGYLDYTEFEKSAQGHYDAANDGEVVYLGTGGTGDEMFTRLENYPLPVNFKKKFASTVVVPGLNSLPVVGDRLFSQDTGVDYWVGSFVDVNGDGALDYVPGLCKTSAEERRDQAKTGIYHESCNHESDMNIYLSTARAARLAEIRSRRGNHRVSVWYASMLDEDVYRKNIESATLDAGVKVVPTTPDVVGRITTRVINDAMSQDYGHSHTVVEEYRYENLLAADFNGLLGFEKIWHWNADELLGQVVVNHQLEHPVEREIDWGAALGIQSYRYYPLAGLPRRTRSLRVHELCAWGNSEACVQAPNGPSFTVNSTERSHYEVADDLQVANDDFHRVRIVFSENTRHAENGAPLLSSGTSFYYDDYGFPVVVVDHGVLDESDDESTVYSRRQHDPARWLLGFGRGQRIYLGEAFGPRTANDGLAGVAMPDFSADPAGGFAGMTLSSASYTDYGSDGNTLLSPLTRSGVWDGARWLVSEALADDYGRVVSATDSTGVQMTTQYVEDTGYYYVAHTLSGANGEPGGTSANFYHLATGGLISSVDANRRTMTFDVDGLGRATKTFEHRWLNSGHYGADLVRRSEFAWDPEISDYYVAEYVFHEESNAYEGARAYIDGFGQTYLERKSSGLQETIDTIGQGDWIEVRSDAPAPGIRRTSAPYRAGAAGEPLWSTTHFDSYGEISAVFLPTGGQYLIETNRNHREITQSQTLSRDFSSIAIDLGDVVYDSQGRVKRQRRNPQTSASHYLYDRVNRSITTTDSLGVARTSSVDVLGRAVYANDPVRGEATAEYNALGQLSRSTLNGQVTTYEYDGLGRMTVRTDEPSAEDAGRVTRYFYDGRAPGVAEIPVGSETSLGRLSAVLYDTGDVDEFRYDVRGNRIFHKRTFAALTESFETAYEYSVQGALLSMVYPDGYRVDYEYDEHLRLSRLRGTGGNTNDNGRVLFEALTFDELDRLTSARTSNGVTVTYEYDEYGRRVHTSHEASDGTALFVESLYWNAANQLVGSDEIQAGINAVIPNGGQGGQHGDQTASLNRGQQYRYDVFDRLTTYCLSDSLYNNMDYSDDCSGNVEMREYTYRDSGAPFTMHRYDNGALAFVKQWEPSTGSPHQLSTLDLWKYDPSGTQIGTNDQQRRFAYDGQGNVTAMDSYDASGNLKTSRALTFDRHNRLMRFETTGSSQGAVKTALYSYGDSRQRLSKTEFDGTQVFYVGKHFEITRTVAGAKLYTRYVQGGSLSMTEGYAVGNYQYPGAGTPEGQEKYYLTDWRGTTRGATDVYGRLRSRTRPAPYGEALKIQGQNNYRRIFTGQERDFKSGALEYFNARYYDSRSHQFLSPDPAGQYDSPYLYTPANPIGYTDPSGRIGLKVLLNSLEGAYDEGRVVVAFGLGRKTDNFTETTVANIIRNAEIAGLDNLTFVDFAGRTRKRSGIGYQVWHAKRYGGRVKYIRQNFDRPASAIRAAFGDAPKDKVVVFAQHDGEPVKIIDSAGQYFKDAFESAYGGQRKFNESVSWCLESGCNAGSSGWKKPRFSNIKYNANHSTVGAPMYNTFYDYVPKPETIPAGSVAKSLGVKVYASPFSITETTQVFKDLGVPASSLSMNKRLQSYFLTTEGIGRRLFKGNATLLEYASDVVDGKLRTTLTIHVDNIDGAGIGINRLLKADMARLVGEGVLARTRQGGQGVLMANTLDDAGRLAMNDIYAGLAQDLGRNTVSETVGISHPQAIQFFQWRRFDP